MFLTNIKKLAVDFFDLSSFLVVHLSKFPIELGYLLVCTRLPQTRSEIEIEEAKIKNGIRLDDRYYIKCFPVWTTGRGNTSVILSKAIGLAAIARYLDDQELLSIAYRQLDWLLGLNPFNQSIMWGEGYRYQALYSPVNRQHCRCRSVRDSHQVQWRCPVLAVG